MLGIIIGAVLQWGLVMHQHTNVSVDIAGSGGLMPYSSSASFLLADVDSGEIVFERQSTRPRAIASLTKLLTVVVALEEYRSDTVFVVPEEATLLEGAKVGLKAGERVLLPQLVAGAIIRSGNDAAETLASGHPGGREAFLALMNLKAKELGMSGTHMVSPEGLDQEYHYSTARDLFTLVKYIRSHHPEIVNVAKMSTDTITTVTGNTYILESTNELLRNPALPVIGLKTGTTDEAGQCFIGMFHNRDGKTYVVIELGSDDRFEEAATVMWWMMGKVGKEDVVIENKEEKGEK